MFDNFNWINKGEIKLDGNKVIMKAAAWADFFCGGSTTSEEGIESKTVKNIRAGE